MSEQLKKYDENTPTFSLKGLKTYGRIVNVIDGDTVDIVIPFFNGEHFYKISTRLIGIDTCEIHSHNDKIKEKGLHAKSRLIELLLNEDIIEVTNKKQIKQIFNDKVIVVWVECNDFDKYGRLLANIYLDKESQSISEILVKENLAYRYDGSTKLTEEEQIEKFHI